MEDSAFLLTRPVFNLKNVHSNSSNLMFLTSKFFELANIVPLPREKHVLKNNLSKALQINIIHLLEQALYNCDDAKRFLL